MGGLVTIHQGYDTDYLTKAVGDGAADYYLSSGGQSGEPPGFWAGRGAAALGLSGTVDADQMRALYHYGEKPDGTFLKGRPERRGAGADTDDVIALRVSELAFPQPEDVARITNEVRSATSKNVPFWDMTFSAAKSISVIHASLLAERKVALEAGDTARADRANADAEAIMAAMADTARYMVGQVEARAAFVRLGAGGCEYHDADGVTAAAFVQRTNRDSSPQLHVHVAVLNAATRALPRADSGAADPKFRTLDSRSLLRERIAISALASRYLDNRLQMLGYALTARADDTGHEIEGVPAEVMEMFSTRRAVITPEVTRLISEYTERHGTAPSARAVWSMKQHVTLKTRAGKPEQRQSLDSDLDSWTRQTEAREVAVLHEIATEARRLACDADGVLRVAPALSDDVRERCARIAVARVQKLKTSWGIPSLLLELHRALPVLPEGTDTAQVLDDLAADIVMGRIDGTEVHQIGPVADPVDVSVLGLRDSDGGSIHRAPGRARFATAYRLDTEEFLLSVARAATGLAVPAARAEAALAGTSLDPTQRTVAEGLLSHPQRANYLINTVVAAAGTGKTFVMAATAKAYTATTGHQVIGLTASTNAARVLADEMRGAGAEVNAMNIAQFLGKIKDSDQTRGHVPIGRGSMVIVDEASQVSTDDLLHIVAVVQQAGGRVVLVGDTAQTSSAEAGGMMALLAHDHGNWKISRVRRMEETWEQDASLLLRAGKKEAIPFYNNRGRIRSGPQNVAYAKAVELWSTDHVRGLRSLLLAGSNEEAAELAAMARARLVHLRKLSPETQLVLSDGNEAGIGDLIRARLNTKIVAHNGRTLSNRDVIRIDGYAGPGHRDAMVRLALPDGTFGQMFTIASEYLKDSAELSYAGNTHVAQGATVDTAHLVVSPSLSRESFYVGATRAKSGNTLHVVTGPAEVPGQQDHSRQAPMEAIITAALRRENSESTATQAMREAQAEAGNAKYLLQIYTALTREDAYKSYDAKIQARISETDYERYLREPERHALLAQLREYDLAGRDIDKVIDGITARDFDGLRSVSAGLYGRSAKTDVPEREVRAPWAQQEPSVRPSWSEAVREAASSIDARAVEIGTDLYDHAPPWAMRYLGVPQAANTEALKKDWIRKAGVVGLYREASGIDDPVNAVGHAPQGSPELARMYLDSVAAMEMVTEEAELMAASQGELESRVRGYAHGVEMWAPADVSKDLQSASMAEADTRSQIEEARAQSDLEMADSASALVSDLVEYRAELSEKQAERDQWAERTADQHHEAEAAASELVRRGVEPEPIEDQQAEPEIRAAEPEIDRQLATARSALERLQADREPSPETEPEQWAREMAEASTESSAAWEAGHVMAEPEHQADEVSAEL